MRDCKAVRRTRIDLEHGVLDDVGRRWTTSKAGRAPAQVGRPHPVSTISALIVSRDKLADTRASFVHRSGGTLIGLVERVITNLSPQPIAQPSWPGRSRCPLGFCAVVVRVVEPCGSAAGRDRSHRSPQIPLYRSARSCLTASVSPGSVRFHWATETVVLTLVIRPVDPAWK